MIWVPTDLVWVRENVKPDEIVDWRGFDKRLAKTSHETWVTCYDSNVVLARVVSRNHDNPLDRVFLCIWRMVTENEATFCELRFRRYQLITGLTTDGSVIRINVRADYRIISLRCTIAGDKCLVFCHLVTSLGQYGATLNEVRSIGNNRFADKKYDLRAPGCLYNFWGELKSISDWCSVYPTFSSDDRLMLILITSGSVTVLEYAKNERLEMCQILKEFTSNFGSIYPIDFKSVHQTGDLVCFRCQNSHFVIIDLSTSKIVWSVSDLNFVKNRLKIKRLELDIDFFGIQSSTFFLKSGSSYSVSKIYRFSNQSIPAKLRTLAAKIVYDQYSRLPNNEFDDSNMKLWNFGSPYDIALHARMALLR